MSTPVTVTLLLLVFVAGIFDLRYRRIPNWLTMTGIAVGIGINCLPGQDGVANSFYGLGCALLVYVPLFLVRGMGAGDVKLMAAVGALTGPGNWVGIFLATALVGGLGAFVLVTARGRWHETSSNLFVICRELLARRAPAAASPELDCRNTRALSSPHGAFIAAGAIAFLAYGRFA